jgi:hypothetical protein
MSFGLYSHNNWGDVLIDDSFVNLTLVERGTFYVPPEVAYRTGGYYVLGMAANEQIFARQHDSSQFMSGDPQGSYIEFHLRNPDGTKGAGHIDYVRMRRSDTYFVTPPNTGYGLNVVTPSGSLAFNSTKGLYGNVVFTAIYTTGQGLTFTLPTLTPNKRRYVSIQSFGFFKTSAIRGSFNSNIRQVVNSCIRFSSDQTANISIMNTWNGPTATINSMYGTTGIQAQTLYSTLPLTFLDI